MNNNMNFNDFGYPNINTFNNMMMPNQNQMMNNNQNNQNNQNIMPIYEGYIKGNLFSDLYDQYLNYQCLYQNSLE